MRSLLSLILIIPLAGCAFMADLEYGPGRLKPADHGAAATYPVQTPSAAEETARPSPGSVAPLHRARPARASARAPRPAATATPAEPPAMPQATAPVADPPKVGKPSKLKKCRAPGGWAVWRKKCPPAPVEGG